MKRLFCTIFLVLALASMACGAVRYVDSRVAASGNGLTPAAAFKTLTEARNVTNTGDTVNVVAGSGPYYEQLNTYGAVDGPITWNFNDCEIRGDCNLNTLVSAATHKWVASTGRPGQYYFVETDDTEPWTALFRSGTTRVNSGVVDGVWRAESFCLTGALPINTGNNWGWGDFDALGFSTLYVKWSGGDPTGQAVQVLASVDDYNLYVQLLSDNYTFNNAICVGASYANVQIGGTGNTFNRCTVKYADMIGFVMAGQVGVTDVSNTTIKHCMVIDSGHQAFSIQSSLGNANPVNIYNNTVVGSHLMLYSNFNSASCVVNFKNNASCKLFAGALYWKHPNCVLNEDHNQFHIDFTSPHVLKAINFIAGGETSYWNTTAATDIPASTNTRLDADASEAACGVDPLFVAPVSADFHLQPKSPCINAGDDSVFRTDATARDYDGRNWRIGRHCDIGAYEYPDPWYWVIHGNIRRRIPW